MSYTLIHYIHQRKPRADWDKRKWRVTDIEKSLQLRGLIGHFQELKCSITSWLVIGLIRSASSTSKGAHAVAIRMSHSRVPSYLSTPVQGWRWAYLTSDCNLAESTMRRKTILAMAGLLLRAKPFLGRLWLPSLSPRNSYDRLIFSFSMANNVLWIPLKEFLQVCWVVCLVRVASY